MAEEKAAEAKPQAAAAPAGQKPVLFIALAVVNMLIVAGLGFMIYSNKQKEQAENELGPVVEGEKAAQDAEANSQEFIGKLVPLETFLVNLAGSRGRKLAKINMEFELNDDKVEAEIDQLKPKIRDVIILVLSSKTYSQVSTSEGKNVLRDEIRDKVNLFLTKGQINRVYFTEFIYN